jgi:hypothetical protein
MDYEDDSKDYYKGDASISASVATHASERAGKYIPLRLDAEERRYLRILEESLSVCEYTDIVDVTFR